MAETNTAILVLDKVLDANPDDNRAWTSLAIAHINSAEVALENRNLPAAGRALDQASICYGKATERSNRTERTYGMARISNLRGQLHMAESDFSMAKEHFQAAIEKLDQLTTENPGDPQYLEESAALKLRLSDIYRITGEYDQESGMYEPVRKIYEQLIDLVPGAPNYRENLGRACSNHAQRLQERGFQLDAQNCAEQALDLFAKLASDYPEVRKYWREAATASDILGQTLSDLKKNQEALQAFSQSLELLDTLKPRASEDEHRRAIVLSHAAVEHFKVGDEETAFEMNDEAIDSLNFLIQQTPASNTPGSTTSRPNPASATRRNGRTRTSGTVAGCARPMGRSCPGRAASGSC
jgi:tetratricopeptide (TPR) repeat protein